MEKDKTILNFINKLKSILDFTLLKVVDYWPSDLCAIGHQRGDKLVYISTFNFVDKGNLKLVDESGEAIINVLKEGRGVTEDELTEELRVFLEV